MLYVSVDFKMVQVKGYLLASCLSCTFCGHWGERGGGRVGGTSCKYIYFSFIGFKPILSANATTVFSKEVFNWKLHH